MSDRPKSKSKTKALQREVPSDREMLRLAMSFVIHTMTDAQVKQMLAWTFDDMGNLLHRMRANATKEDIK